MVSARCFKLSGQEHCVYFDSIVVGSLCTIHICNVLRFEHAVMVLDSIKHTGAACHVAFVDVIGCTFVCS